MNIFSRRSIQRTSGFSLPELMVVIGIMAIISGVTFAKYKNFTSDSALSNTIYDVALTIRQTQLYGIAVKESTDTTNQFQTGYGMHFSMQQPTQYLTYQDVYPLEDYYDSSNSQEIVATHVLPQGFTIKKVCKIDAGNRSCADTSVPSAFVDIEFVRPNPDTILTTNISSENTLMPVPSMRTYAPDTDQTSYYGACVYLTSGTKDRSVYIDKTGQISTNSASCPLQ